MWNILLSFDSIKLVLGFFHLSDHQLKSSTDELASLQISDNNDT